MRQINPFVCFYTMVLLSANCVGNYSLQLFHFVYSSSTLLVQFAFCALFVLTEAFGLSRTVRVIWGTAFLNLCVAIVVYPILGSQIPEFWLEHSMFHIKTHYPLYLSVMFTLTYLATALIMANFAESLRELFKREWLLCRAVTVILLGVFIDVLALFPILSFLTLDTYMVKWKMLSLVTVKMLFCGILLLPTYYLARHMGRRMKASY